MDTIMRVLDLADELLEADDSDDYTADYTRHIWFDSDDAAAIAAAYEYIVLEGGE